ncbi:DUF5320 domain-containing protein [Fusibacter sp. JL216-2]|uniref:DUF5320 domain-containing protein n=1 Tax=Fusibacter sp. JL216-2 TaxID=3071453 RepID=UPI003D350333
MPRLNGMGPAGYGQMSGRGLGLCRQNSAEPSAEDFRMNRRRRNRRKASCQGAFTISNRITALKDEIHRLETLMDSEHSL